MWRPREVWNNPYKKDPNYVPLVMDVQGTRNLMHNAFEAGADAMLNALRTKSYSKITVDKDKIIGICHPDEDSETKSGVFVFIPDEEVKI